LPTAFCFCCMYLSRLEVLFAAMLLMLPLPTALLVTAGADQNHVLAVRGVDCKHGEI